MAEIVFKDPHLHINNVDLSDHVRQVTIKYAAEILDKTAGGVNSKGKIAGLKDWSMDIEFNQDFAAASVDATIFPLVGAAAFPVLLNPAGDTTGAANPAYTGNAIVGNYTLGGAVGQLATAPVTLEGDGDLLRAVT